MSTHVIVGAGPIGTGIAARLAEEGHTVTLASRSGVTDPPAGVIPARVDARDGEGLTALARGADTVVNALNPPQYHRWSRDWPPMAQALLRAAEQSGAGLITMSNLYGYGPQEGPLTESLPLAATGVKGRIRAQMWSEALALHHQGRIRATELRASDYFGATARPGTSVLNSLVISRAARGRSVWLVGGSPDTTHSWTYLPDIVELGARLATDERSWGRAWHVPTAEPRTMREVAADVNDLAGAGPSPIRLLPRAVRLALRAMPVIRELDETAYQFERPFVLDSSQAEATFALAPTPWRTALAETIRGLASAKEAVGAH
jgi:nucleoside-diphosphate-sugar epimerase